MKNIIMFTIIVFLLSNAVRIPGVTPERYLSDYYYINSVLSIPQQQLRKWPVIFAIKLCSLTSRCALKVSPMQVTTCIGDSGTVMPDFR